MENHTNLYVSGLPEDVTVPELMEHFKIAGIIKLDHNEQPLIKLYLNDEGKPKGDARITFLKEESIALAIELRDGADLRPGIPLTVEKAVFQMKGEKFVAKESTKKQKLEGAPVAAISQKQYVSWVSTLIVMFVPCCPLHISLSHLLRCYPLVLVLYVLTRVSHPCIPSN